MNNQTILISSIQLKRCSFEALSKKKIAFEYKMKTAAIPLYDRPVKLQGIDLNCG
jgi:hypothetical protein